jgi:two-component system, NarL family, invasion response regulator UvrY
MKFLIVDDYAIIRKRLMEALGECYPDASFKEAANGFEALNEIENNAFDMVLMDINMPGMNGFETLKKAKLNALGAPVLMMSLNEGGYYANKAIDSGAAGFISKDSEVEEFIEAIDEVSKGRIYLNLKPEQALAY